MSVLRRFGFCFFVFLMLLGCRCFGAAEVADSYTMFFSSFGKGSELVGNSYVFLTGCGEDTRIVEAVCSNENVEAEFDLSVSAEGLGDSLDLRGRNCTVSLSVRNRKRLRDNSRALVSVTVEEGGSRRVLTTRVVFRQVSFKNIFRRLVINGRDVNPQPKNIKRRQYLVRFRPRGAVKVRAVARSGFRVRSIVYWYRNKKVSWAVGMKRKRNGGRAPFRFNKGTVKYFEIFVSLRGGEPSGLTDDQRKLYRYTQNAGLGMGLPALGMHFS